MKRSNLIITFEDSSVQKLAFTGMYSRVDWSNKNTLLLERTVDTLFNIFID